MKNCEDCGKEINDKYFVCQECAVKRKEKAEKEPKKENEIVTALGSLNNNLYYIREALALIIEKEYKAKIVWSKETKRFERK